MWFNAHVQRSHALFPSARPSSHATFPSFFRSCLSRGGLTTNSAYRAAHRRFLSSKIPKDGGAASGRVEGGKAGTAAAEAPAASLNKSKSEILAARQARKAGTAGGGGGSGLRRGKLGSGAKVTLAMAGGGALTLVAWQQKREMFNGTILECAVVWLTDWVAQARNKGRTTEWPAV